jgi:hypothetical protein
VNTPGMRLHPRLRANRDLELMVAVVVILDAVSEFTGSVPAIAWLVVLIPVDGGFIGVALGNRLSVAGVEGGTVTTKRAGGPGPHISELKDLRVFSLFSCWITSSAESGHTLARVRPYRSDRQIARLATDLSLRLDRRE